MERGERGRHFWRENRQRLFFPPAVPGAAEGLRHAVHRLAERDGDGLVFTPVFVLPGGEEEKAAFCTGSDAVGRGMIDGREAVVGDEHHGEATVGGLVDDGLLALGNAGADEDGTLGRRRQTASLLLFETRRVFPMADDGQQATLKEGAVAVAVAGDTAVFEKEAALYDGEGIGGGKGWRALTLQEAAQGGYREGGVYAATLGLKAGAVVTAQPAAPGVVTDIGALGLQLSRLDGHHVAIAGRKKRGAAAAAARRRAKPGGRTAGSRRGGGRGGRGSRGGDRGRGGRGDRGGHKGGGTHGSQRFPRWDNGNGGGGYGGSGKGGHGGRRGGNRGLLPGGGPEGPVAAFFEAGDDLPQMGRTTAFRHDGGTDNQDEMQVLGHDDVGVERYHRIMGGDSGR